MSLTSDELLAGSSLVHEVPVPAQVLRPAPETGSDARDAPAAPDGGTVRMRPLSVATLMLIGKAAADDPGLVPLLVVKEALVEPVLGLDEIRRLQVGLVHHLVAVAYRISGLSDDGEALRAAVQSPLGRTQLLLAQHFGWTPEQVSSLTPGQVAVYLAGIESLRELAQPTAGDRESVA